jgi:hypothetical protein
MFRAATPVDHLRVTENRIINRVNELCYREKPEFNSGDSLLNPMPWNAQLNQNRSVD